jgi:hypothetical protein
VVWPSGPPDVTVTMQVTDYSTGSGVPDASISICTACPCPGPYERVLAEAQTDSNGYFTAHYSQALTPSGQSPILCIQTIADGRLTNLGYDGFPYTQPVVSKLDSLLPPVSWTNPSWPPSDLYQRIAYTGITQDPALGVITAVVHDCLGSPAGGVHVSINTADAAAWPAVDGGVDGHPTAVTAEGGTYFGIASFFNVPPGDYTLTASVPGIGRVGQDSVSTAADSSTGTSIVPSP